MNLDLLESALMTFWLCKSNLTLRIWSFLNDCLGLRLVELILEDPLVCLKFFGDSRSVLVLVPEALMEVLPVPAYF
jgi:hypothetical protein